MPGKPRPEGRATVTVDWKVDKGLEGKVAPLFMESVLADALSGRKLGNPLEVSLTITTDEEIRELNRRYRDVDAATDVLSFPLLEYERPEQPENRFPLPPGEPLPLGDIVVSYPRAVEQAEAYGHSLDRELAFLIVHGAMHLLGYDHQSPADEQQMRREEEAVLSGLNLTHSPTRSSTPASARGRRPR